MIFVTGSTGYLGRNLIKFLFSHGVKVQALVHNHLKADSIKKYCEKIVVGDINNSVLLTESLKGVDTVIHLAAIIKTTDPLLYEHINSKGTEVLCSCCVKAGVKRIIYISSAQAEENFGSLYGISKKEGEEIVKKSGLRWTILRPILVFGADGERDLTLLIKFIGKYSIIPIMGKGFSLIQPVYISDMVDVIVAVLSCDGNNNICDQKTYSIAGIQKITLSHFVDMVTQVAGLKRLKLHIPLTILRPLVFIYERLIRGSSIDSNTLRYLEIDKIADISSARKELGFNPILLEEGIQKTLEFNRIRCKVTQPSF